MQSNSGCWRRGSREWGEGRGRRIGADVMSRRHFLLPSGMVPLCWWEAARAASLTASDPAPTATPGATGAAATATVITTTPTTTPATAAPVVVAGSAAHALHPVDTATEPSATEPPAAEPAATATAAATAAAGKFLRGIRALGGGVLQLPEFVQGNTVQALQATAVGSAAGFLFGMLGAGPVARGAWGVPWGGAFFSSGQCSWSGLSGV